MKIVKRSKEYFDQFRALLLGLLAAGDRISAAMSVAGGEGGGRRALNHFMDSPFKILAAGKT